MAFTTTLRSAITVALAMTMAGCDKTKAPGTLGADPLPAESYPRIAALEGLGGWIVMATPPRVDPGPPLQVTVAARAKTEKENLAVQYRYNWFDSAGRPAGGTDWRYLLMPSRVEVFFEGNALDRNATDWRLEIRPAR